jgi:hypothetical protein
MVRRFALALQILPLVLAILLAIAWLRSYTHAEGVSYRHIDWDRGTISAIVVTSGAGVVHVERSINWYHMDRLRLMVTAEAAARPRGRFYSRRAQYGYPTDTWLQKQGVDAGHERSVLRDPTWVVDRRDYVMLPHWLLTCVFAMAPAFLFARVVRYVRRVRRIRRRACIACGYDLRAQRAGDACPECGTAPAAK